MKNKILMGLAAIVMVAVLASCGKKPQVEIDATNAAITAAQTAEANVYLPAEFAALNDSMNTINAAITAKEGKLFKNFKDEVAKLEALKVKAGEVAGNVAAKKEEIKKGAETILNDIKAVVAENAKLVMKLPKGKEGAAIIEQFKADLGNVDAAVAEAQGLFDKGAYMEALKKIEAAKAKADSLNSEMKEALKKARIRF